VNPWQAEWDVLLGAIRNDRPHNEARERRSRTLGRSWARGRPHREDRHMDEALASNFMFCPNVDSLTADSPAPVQADAEGRYPAPIPAPGKKSERAGGQVLPRRNRIV